jgi:hypothetical protein
MGTVVKAARVLDASAVANVVFSSTNISPTVSVAGASAVGVGTGGILVMVAAAVGISSEGEAVGIPLAGRAGCACPQATKISIIINNDDAMQSCEAFLRLATRLSIGMILSITATLITALLARSRCRLPKNIGQVINMGGWNVIGCEGR